MLTRRDVLKLSLLAAAPLGCASVPVRERTAGEHAVLSTSLAIEDGISRALDALGTPWLSRGDSVLVKLACNSGNAHPAVTSPRAVVAVCRALRARGAGRVLVGDQSGVMEVRLAVGNRRYSSTRARMEQNGLRAAVDEGGGELRCFDEGDYEADYVAASLPRGTGTWAVTPRIARVATQVDHIVYLPRLSAHLLAGYTHGHKLAVGFLRDDARHQMHFDAANIYEKYAELNYARELRSRLRLVLTAVERVLVRGGPDMGAEVACEPAIVLASAHLANHDALAVQLLGWAREELTPAGGPPVPPFGPWSSALNTGFLAAVEPATGIPWRSSGEPTSYLPHDFDAGPATDRALAHAYALLGGA